MENFCLLYLCCAVYVFAFFNVEGRRNFGCRDQNNNPIDWWAGYKLPEIESSSIPSVKEGYGFLYLDSSHPAKWQYSNVDVNNRGQALDNTLQQLYKYKQEKDVFHLLYNDEFPNGTYSLTKGHTKGSVLFDFTSGFWLIHSIPKFPHPDHYEYAQNARRYGQSMLCISFSYSELKSIGIQLLYNDPYIYSSSLPELMARNNPELKLALEGKKIRNPPWTSQIKMYSTGKQQFVGFAKQGHKWNKDLYFDLVAPSLKVSLDTETWQNGGGDLESWCNSSYTVHNVKSLKLLNKFSFTETDDHSKWAVASGQKDSPFVCIGDINRQFGQLHRGGGTMCIMNKELWNVYKSTIEKVWECKSGEKSMKKNSFNYFEKELFYKKMWHSY